MARSQASAQPKAIPLDARHRTACAFLEMVVKARREDLYHSLYPPASHTDMPTRRFDALLSRERWLPVSKSLAGQDVVRVHVDDIVGGEAKLHTPWLNHEYPKEDGLYGGGVPIAMTNCVRVANRSRSTLRSRILAYFPATHSMSTAPYLVISMGAAKGRVDVAVIPEVSPTDQSSDLKTLNWSVVCPDWPSVEQVAADSPSRGLFGNSNEWPGYDLAERGACASPGIIMPHSISEAIAHLGSRHLRIHALFTAAAQVRAAEAVRLAAHRRARKDLLPWKGIAVDSSYFVCYDTRPSQGKVQPQALLRTRIHSTCCTCICAAFEGLCGVCDETEEAREEADEQAGGLEEAEADAGSEAEAEAEEAGADQGVASTSAERVPPSATGTTRTHVVLDLWCCGRPVVLVEPSEENRTDPMWRCEHHQAVARIHATTCAEEPLMCTMGQTASLICYHTAPGRRAEKVVDFDIPLRAAEKEMVSHILSAAKQTERKARIAFPNLDRRIGTELSTDTDPSDVRARETFDRFLTEEIRPGLNEQRRLLDEHVASIDGSATSPEAVDAAIVELLKDPTIFASLPDKTGSVVRSDRRPHRRIASDFQLVPSHFPFSIYKRRKGGQPPQKKQGAKAKLLRWVAGRLLPSC